MKKVDYQKIVEELFNTPLSDNKDDDNSIKKLIANINFGLLEKSQNKQQKTYVFGDLSERKHYQSQYGGNLNIISKIEQIHGQSNNPLDKDIEDADLLTATNTVKEYYALNIYGRSTFKKGFRYSRKYYYIIIFF